MCAFAWFNKMRKCVLYINIDLGILRWHCVQLYNCTEGESWWILYDLQAPKIVIQWVCVAKTKQLTYDSEIAKCETTTSNLMFKMIAVACLAHATPTSGIMSLSPFIHPSMERRTNLNPTDLKVVRGKIEWLSMFLCSHPAQYVAWKTIK